MFTRPTLTAIGYRITDSGKVRLDVYNILGQIVATLVNEEKRPGDYNIIWNGKDSSGRDMPSGVYFYRLKSTNFSCVKKMALLR